MKIIIGEDELDAREYLIRILRKHFVQCPVVAICDNVPDAVTQCANSCSHISEAMAGNLIVMN